MQPRQQPPQVISATNRIAVHAATPGAGKDLRQPLFALFGARTKIVKVLALALWTVRRYLALESAIVTLQPLALPRYSSIFRRRFMVGQRDRAVLTFELFSAGPADHGKRVAAAVEENERLLAAVQSLAR